MGGESRKRLVGLGVMEHTGGESGRANVEMGGAVMPSQEDASHARLALSPLVSCPLPFRDLKKWGGKLRLCTWEWRHPVADRV
jgi:hypothetical protein